MLQKSELTSARVVSTALYLQEVIITQDRVVVRNTDPALPMQAHVHAKATIMRYCADEFEDLQAALTDDEVLVISRRTIVMHNTRLKSEQLLWCRALGSIQTMGHIAASLFFRCSYIKQLVIREVKGMSIMKAIKAVRAWSRDYTVTYSVRSEGPGILLSHTSARTAKQALANVALHLKDLTAGDLVVHRVFGVQARSIQELQNVRPKLVGTDVNQLFKSILADLPDSSRS